MSDPIKQLVESRHPLYEDKVAHWDFLQATCEGGREWFKGNIFRYLKEGDKEYEDRVKRAYRFNHTRNVVETVDKYLFKMSIARKTKDAPAELRKFWENATLTGLSINDYVKRLSAAASTFGRVWAVVDSREVGENGVQIYSHWYRPQDALDMSYDDEGVLNWILLREFVRDDADPLSSSRKTIERYRLWTRDAWALFERRETRGKVRYELAEDGVHDLGVVPVINVDYQHSEELYEAPGLIDDIAYLDRANANYLSNLDAIIQDQTFSQLTMPAQAVMPGEAAHDALMRLGTSRVFTYHGETSHKPEFISPDPSQAGMILSAIGKIINEIYHSTGLSGERTKDDNGGGVDNASGVAKAYDFERINALLASKAMSLQVAEERLAALVLMWSGMNLEQATEKAQGLITYPEEFDTRGVYDEFEIAARLSLLTAPDEFRREQMRGLIDKLFPAASTAVRKKLEDSLKDWPPEPAAEGTLSAPGSARKPNQSSGSSAVKAAGAQRVAKEMAA